MTPNEAVTARERVAKWVVISPSGCWEWTGHIGSNGYGLSSLGGRKWKAHRLSYVAHVGPVPEGLDLDHLCRVRHCVNPEHLEPVTRSVNLRRGVNRNRLKTHCIRRHELSGDNIYVDSYGRHCRTCAIARAAATYARKIAKERKEVAA